MLEKILYDVTACDDTGIRFSVKERLTEADARREVKEILFQFPRKLHNPRIKIIKYEHEIHTGNSIPHIHNGDCNP